MQQNNESFLDANSIYAIATYVRGDLKQSITSFTNSKTNEIIYVVELPVPTAKGWARAQFKLESLTLESAMQEADEVSAQHEQKLKDAYNKSVLLAPPSPKESLKLVTP